MIVGAPYGVHGLHEALAVRLGRSLESDPIGQDRVFPYPVNEEAIAQGLRMVDENMAISLVNADPASPIYERRRAAETLGWVAAGGFDLVLDFHTTPYKDDNYACIGLNTSNETIVAAHLLGFRNLIVGNFGLPHMVDNALTIEIYAGKTEEERKEVIATWRQKIEELLDYDSLDDLAEDYSNYSPLDIWSYQNSIFLDDAMNTEELLSEDYADGSFTPIHRCDVPILGIDPVIDDRRYTPYAVSCGGAFERLGGVYGEYVFYVGKSEQRDAWRKLARSMSPSNVEWVTPDMVLPADVLAKQ
jgi:hypothetical protein